MGKIKKLDFALGVLNGAVGDYLARTQNGLALPMELVDASSGAAIAPDAIATVVASPSSRVVVLVHGLMCTESVFRFEDGSDYGAFLARDFGVTPLYVRYNSGLAIPDSGAALAKLLEEVVRAYPVPIEELVAIGFSMGGLVIRAACHAAAIDNHAWLPLLRRAFYLGTPHLGAPLERIGRVVTKALRAFDDPYTRLIADLADLRSDGVKDLGDADLRHEDRARRRARFFLRDPEHPVPLLSSIDHYLVAGTLSNDPTIAAFFGDSVVPVPSGTNGRCIDAASLALPPSRVRIVGRAHVPLAHDPEVYEILRAWWSEAAGAVSEP